VQFGHEALAKAHDLGVRPAARVEGRASLCATERQPRQAVLERLFKGQKLQHAFRQVAGEPESALVGADGV